MKRRRIYAATILLFLLGCSHPIRHDNLFTYQRTETSYCDIFSQGEIRKVVADDFDKIYANLSRFLSQTISLNIQTCRVKIGILPFQNTVCDFSKRGTTTFCYVKRKTIYLLDIDNLPKSIIDTYGYAPDDYYNNAFTHELVHVFTIPNNRFSGSLCMEERIANFCSFLDFTKENIELSQEAKKALHENIQYSFPDRKIKDIMRHSLNALQARDTWEVSFFMLCLFETNNIDMLKMLITSKSMSSFIDVSRWNQNNTIAFVDWIRAQ